MFGVPKPMFSGKSCFWVSKERPTGCQDTGRSCLDFTQQVLLDEILMRKTASPHRSLTSVSDVMNKSPVAVLTPSCALNDQTSMLKQRFNLYFVCLLFLNRPSTHKNAVFYSIKKVKNIKTTLVGGLNPSEKYESQLGWLETQYMGK